MTPTLIVIGFLVVAAVVIFLATRSKPGSTSTGPREGDTAWNDRVSPGEQATKPTDETRP